MAAGPLLDTGGTGEGRAPWGQRAQLVDDPARRARLGAWGREWVAGRFSLDSATTAFEELYARVPARPAGAARMTSWLRDLEQMTRYEFTEPAALRMLGR